MPPSVWDCQVDFEKIILVLAIKWSRIGTCSKSVGSPEFISAFLSPNPHPILLQILSILMTSCALNPFLPTTNLPCKFPYPSILSYLLVSVPTLLRAFKTEKIFSLSIVFVSWSLHYNWTGWQKRKGPETLWCTVTLFKTAWENRVHQW